MNDLQTLKAALAFSEDVIGAASCGILVYRQTGECVLANPAALEIAGGTMEQLLAQNFRELESWRKSGMLAMAETALATGQKQREEFHSISVSGQKIWITCQFSVFVKDGEQFLLLVTEDNTSRREMEQTVQNSEMRYRTLFEAAPVGIVSFKATGEAVSANAAAAEIVGASVAQMLQKNFRELASWKNSGMLAAAEETLATGREVRREVFFTSTFGKASWLNTRFTAFTHEGGQYLLVMMSDVTERKQQEEQLRKLSRAVEQSPVSIVITDPRGQIEYVNPRFSQVTGYAPDEVLGKNPRILKPDNGLVNQGKAYKKLWATITAGKEWHGEFHNKKKNGELFWEAASISPITDANGHITHFLAVKEDITRHKLLEDEFRQAQKMDAFGKLAAGVAHDFNNILTAILGYAELVKMSLPAKTKSRGEMVEIIKMAERATNLTRQLLLFSRRQAMQLKELELNDVVENITKMLRRLIGEHITLNAQFCPGQTPLLADAGMLEQVLMNLAVNSRDAMPKGGVLTIQTKLAKFEKAEARRRPGRFLCLSVSDTGTGIAPEHLERIFEPFFTTKDIGKGTGLGLATVFGIVEQHKGWIEVETQVGIGTAFHIYLPYHESETDTNPEHSLKSRERGGTETILLVEDELSVRELARDILLKNGYRVFEAESGVAALGVWQQHQADIHLLVTDLVMPGYFTGQELSQRLLSDKPALKVILTSGYHDEMMTEDSKLRHAPNFLPKPFTYDELLRKVRTALD